MEITFKGAVEKTAQIIPKLTVDELKNRLLNTVYYPHTDCRIGTVKIDESAVIAPDCKIDATGDVTIGKDVMLSSGVILYTHVHKIDLAEPLFLTQVKRGIGYKDKVIDNDVWVNTRSIILPNCVHIAKGVIIGAGSIVTKSIDEEYAIYAGNPARKIKSRVVP